MHGCVIKPVSNARCRREARRQWQMLRRMLRKEAGVRGESRGAGGRSPPPPGLAPSQQPRRIRLHIAPASDELHPGDRLQVKAMLFPVPGQVLPGGRDMQRELYFTGIGGVGYSYGGARRVEPSSETRGEG